MATYSPDWNVTVGGTGLDADTERVKLSLHEDRVDSVLIEVSITDNDYAGITADDTIDVDLIDTGGTIQHEFVGFVDSATPSNDSPTLQIEGRAPAGKLDDVTIAGQYTGSNVWQVIDDIIDGGASQIRSLSFDATTAKSNYGTFTGETDYGDVDVSYFELTTDESFTQQDTLSSRDKRAALDFSSGSYSNTTPFTWTLTLTGKDKNGDTVKGTLPLPPGDSATEAYGTITPKLAMSDNRRRFAKVESIRTDILTLVLPGLEVEVHADVANHVKTDWSWSADKNRSVGSALQTLADYLTTVDTQPWEYYVDDAAREVKFQPVSLNATNYTATEGDNVTYPDGLKSLDRTSNFIKIVGRGDIKAWAWAINGERRSAVNDPTDNLSTAGSQYDTGDRGNGIDEIGLRAPQQSLQSDNIQLEEAARRVAERILDQRIRDTVRGSAAFPGVHPIEDGDTLTVDYPSRNITATDLSYNTFNVPSVSVELSNDSALTTAEFGTERTDLVEIVRAVSAQRTLLEFASVAGSVIESIGDKWLVAGDDGGIYEVLIN